MASPVGKEYRIQNLCDQASDKFCIVKSQNKIFCSQTENPIAYKQSLCTNELRASASWEEERRNVRGLPDVLPPIASSGAAAGDGGIIAKIAASRKERHEAAIEDMRQELAGISAVRSFAQLL